MHTHFTILLLEPEWALGQKLLTPGHECGGNNCFSKMLLVGHKLTLDPAPKVQKLRGCL